MPDNGKVSNDSAGTELKESLKDNIALLKGIFYNDKTIIFREFDVNGGSIRCCIITAEGMMNSDIANRDIARPIMESSFDRKNYNGGVLDFVKDRVLASVNVEKSSDIDKIVGYILYGSTVLLFDGEKHALIVESKGWEARAITEPDTESVVRGPREGFNESLLVNMSLIRRRIRSPELKFVLKEIGTRTRTKSVICYIDGIANEKILQELYKRFDSIDADSILDSGKIDEYIRDAKASPFRTVGSTERPDVVASRLLEGRVALLCENSPFALTVPYIFIENFQSNEDYYVSYIYASFYRILRYFCFFLTVSVPSIYTAVITYHQEMIPTPLLVSISASRQGVPFPTILEVVLMLTVFEILREAGVRLPKPIGQAVSIVGALVLGEAAVSAKVVGAILIIIVSLTGISSFAVPRMQTEILVVRAIYLLLAATLGLYGYMFGVMGLFVHLASIRSFGIPYMLNVTSLEGQDLKDTVIRAPWWHMIYRPKLIGNKNSRRYEGKSKQ